MEKKLKSMVEFVKEQKENNTIDLAQRFINSYEHAILLSQTPNIGMFVPAVCENNVWRVLEDPINCDGIKCEKNGCMTDLCTGIYKNEYQQAQSKVIFKWWFVAENQDTKPTDVKTITNGKIHLFWFNNIQGWYLSRGIHTLEDLVKFNLEMI
jgi:hypothetical protein